MKALQTFNKEYLDHCRTMKPDQIAKFLDDFRLLHGGAKPTNPSKLISIKIPIALLESFRAKCETLEVPYQTQIKKLMVEWLATV